MVIREYSITKERTTIGRKAHNDIQIDNLAVSGEHAMIVTILNDSFLEDLGSTNGTLVNGQAIKKHFLQANDVVEIGKYKLKYHTDQPAQGALSDFEKTIVMRAPPAAARDEGGGTATVTAIKPGLRDTVVNPEMMRSQAGMNTATRTSGITQTGGFMRTGAIQTGGVSPAATGQAVGSVQILSGASAGKELPLNKALTTLGKPGIQVAVIAKRPQGYYITHVEGSNFPMINGRQIDAQAHALHDHDVIELAGVKMEFYLKPGG
jgi:pSer/pThr/pTyr-binding forkhead associated (FHA) protein